MSDLRVINGQRGRVAIFKVDDRSEAIEAVANETILDANRDALRDDEFVVVQGKVQPDRFNGGSLRLNVTHVWDLPAARARFGRYLSVQVNGDIVPLTELVRQWPARRTSDEHGDSIHGLGVRIKVRTEGAAAELDLGDQGRFWPSDDALARWKQIMPAQPPQVVYD